MANTTKRPARRKKTDVVVKPLEIKELDGDTLAKKKVEELLEGIELAKKEKEVVVDKLVDATKEKENTWLENQITSLTEELEKITNVNKKLVAENQILSQKSGNNEDFNKVLEGVERLFFELVNTSKSYDSIYLNHLLKKMVNYLPFLNKSMQKRNLVTHK